MRSEPPAAVTRPPPLRALRAWSPARAPSREAAREAQMQGDTSEPRRATLVQGPSAPRAEAQSRRQKERFLRAAMSRPLAGDASECVAQRGQVALASLRREGKKDARGHA